MARTAVIAGIGPGTGAALATRFAAEGYTVALVARTAEKLAPIAAAIRDAGGQALEVPADAGDPAAVAAAAASIRDQAGDPEVLIYNAGTFQIAGILDITPEAFESSWKANCYGAFLWSQQVLPAMVQAANGTCIYTGATAALRGSSRFSTLAVGKFGLRALAQSIAREFGPQGIHAAHVIIDGMIDTPRVRSWQPDKAPHTLVDPTAIAETYWQLHNQSPRAWTQEMDLRPSVERF